MFILLKYRFTTIRLLSPKFGQNDSIKEYVGENILKHMVSGVHAQEIWKCGIRAWILWYQWVLSVSAFEPFIIERVFTHSSFT